MEIYRCLNDIITEIEIEKEENIIVLARTIHGCLTIIDLHKLKYNPRLEGAEVFKMLFGISDNNPFGLFLMGKDEDGYITILRDLHINQGSWILFNIFLNTGSVPNYEDYKLGKDYKYNFVVSNINSLQDICCKFGGLPSFDLFRENFYKEEEYTKKTTFNTPEEDIEGKFQWKKVKASNPLLPHPNASEGWSCGSTSYHEKTLTAYHNYRRDWNWDLTNVIDEIPINEEELDYMLDLSNDPLEQTIEQSFHGTGQPLCFDCH